MLYTIGKACALDIESNRLLEDSIDFKQGFPLKLKNDSSLWCISVTDLQTNITENIVHVSVDITKAWLKDILIKFDTIVTHNGIKFDLPALSLFGVLEYSIGYLNQKDTVFGKECIFLDTLILSRLLNPSRPNGHSLKQWGIRLDHNKIDYRQKLIDLGVLSANDKDVSEFSFFHLEMVDYCNGDTELTGILFKKLWNDILVSEYQAVKMEHKLADLAINREMFGFDFDADLARDLVVDLDSKLNELREKVNPLLPKKSFNKTELNKYSTPKNQLKKDGSLSSHMISFIKHFNIDIYSYLDTKTTVFQYKEKEFPIGFQGAIETERDADISDTDHIKEYLIELGWIPTEWRSRDFTKTADKKSLPYDKRIIALQRYLRETYEGKYKNLRCKDLGITDPNDKNEYKRVYKEMAVKLKDNFPVRAITSPATKTGVSKDLCPNLLYLGDKVEFAKDFSLYTTYKHRRSTIADKLYFVEDYYDDEEISPEKGYLASVREDGRISTPAIEIGATCVTLDTIVKTKKSDKKISDIKIGDEVLTHKFNYKSVTDIIDNGVADIFEVELENGLKIQCTENHAFYTSLGWVKCKDLTEKHIIYHL